MQQMTLFDCFPDAMSILEAPILLKPEQIVYKVVRGDIETYKCSSWTWTYGEKGRGYDLNSLEGKYHATAFNDLIGETFFTDQEKAKAQAKKNLRKYDVIFAKDIVAEKVIAYAFWVHKTDINPEEHEVVHFYAKLNNGLCYFGGGGVYDHIPTEQHQNRLINEFERGMQRALEGNTAYKSWELTDYKPTFKNMYKTKNNDTWLYASANYEFFR